MVRTYFADITPLLENEIYNRYYQNVPAWRKEKADRIRRSEGKAQSIGVWALFERAKRMAGIDGECPHNLSHSGRYVLCALDDRRSDTMVGCDVELMKEAMPHIARRFFSKSEYWQVMCEKEEGGRADLFYRFWVLKESFMKATGQGMGLPLDSFEIDFDRQNLPFLKRQPKEYAEKYYYKEYACPRLDARVAVCTTSEEIAEEMKVVFL